MKCSHDKYISSACLHFFDTEEKSVHLALSLHHLISYGPLRMYMPKLADLQKLTFISSKRTLGAFLMTYLEQWLIGTGDKRVKGIHAFQMT